MKVLITLLVVAAIVVAGFLIFVYSGWYNIAATAHHNSLTRWGINTLTENSIEHRTDDIVVPDLSDSLMIARGFEHYNETCVDCHGAPGVKPEEFAEGLYPKAPPLHKVAAHAEPAELFWITKHGIKMTGMPAFGVNHSDEQIWHIVAFLKTLPNVTPEEYQHLRESSGGEHEGHEHGEEADED
ncbi:MAG: cytochrome c [Candidatus Zixiibacteriota bacterium]|jgi:mono/diheme cytochrome c family protein